MLDQCCYYSRGEHFSLLVNLERRRITDSSQGSHWFCETRIPKFDVSSDTVNKKRKRYSFLSFELESKVRSCNTHFPFS